MSNHTTFGLCTAVEQLNTLANLVELALYAPDGEITFDGRAALQRAARQIVVLSSEITGVRDTSPSLSNEN